MPRFAGQLALAVCLWLLAAGARADQVPAPRTNRRVIAWSEDQDTVVYATFTTHMGCDLLDNATGYEIRALRSAAPRGRIVFECPPSSRSLAVFVERGRTREELTQALKLEPRDRRAPSWRRIAPLTRWKAGPYSETGAPLPDGTAKLATQARDPYLVLRLEGRDRRLLWLPRPEASARPRIATRAWKTARGSWVVIVRREWTVPRLNPRFEERIYAFTARDLRDRGSLQASLLERAPAEASPFYAYRSAAELGPIPEAHLSRAICSAAESRKDLALRWVNDGARLDEAKRRALVDAITRCLDRRSLRRARRVLSLHD